MGFSEHPWGTRRYLDNADRVEKAHHTNILGSSMQNRYTGDIGDYVKYGLLRALADGRNLGVAWYLFPDEDHNDDGRHVGYLNEHGRWHDRDPALFDVLKRIVADDQRNVAAIEQSGILGATYSREVLSAPEITPAKRRDWRGRWFENVLSSLVGCDIVFADPDNGLCEDEKFRPSRVKDWKRLPLREAKVLAEGRTAVIYHHNTRWVGGHENEIAYWIDQLGSGTLALRWRAYSSRTFFVVNPACGMNDQLIRFSQEWGPKAELHGLSG